MGTVLQFNAKPAPFPPAHREEIDSKVEALGRVYRERIYLRHLAQLEMRVIEQAKQDLAEAMQELEVLRVLERAALRGWIA